MKNRLLFPALVFALILQAGVAQSQKLTVQIEGGKQVDLARSDIEALPHAKVTTGASGASATFEGVALEAVLEKAGVEFGADSEGETVDFMFVGRSCRWLSCCDCAARNRSGIHR